MTLRLGILVAALLGASLFVGDAGVGLADSLILWQIRLPRTVLAAMAGGALALSGAALQGALRNRLADPGLLGIAARRHSVAVIAYYWGIGLRFALATPLAGLVGGGVGAHAALRLRRPRAEGAALILAGIGLSAHRVGAPRPRPDPGAQSVRPGRDYAMADGQRGKPHARRRGARGASHRRRYCRPADGSDAGWTR